MAHKGAVLTSADCSEVMIEYAKNKADQEGLRIDHHVINANNLNDIHDDYYDVVLCSMMLLEK